MLFSTKTYRRLMKQYRLTITPGKYDSEVRLILDVRLHVWRHSFWWGVTSQNVYVRDVKRVVNWYECYYKGIEIKNTL